MNNTNLRIGIDKTYDLYGGDLDFLFLDDIDFTKINVPLYDC